MERAYSHFARHPIRRALLPVAEGAADRGENIRLFLMTFVAGFLAFYGLIA